jgi:hypothetical protein
MSSSESLPIYSRERYFRKYIRMLIILSDFEEEPAIILIKSITKLRESSDLINF